MKFGFPWKAPVGPLVRPLEALVIAVWAGLLSGLVQAFGHDLTRLFLHRIVTLGTHRYWMAPLMTALILLVPAGIMAVVIWLRPSWGWRSVVSTILIFFAALNITLIVPGIDVIAKLLLAAGIAAVAVRGISRTVPDSRPW